MSGITLLMQYYPAECYYYRNFNNEELSEAELGVTPASFSCEDSTPFLLVNIGTGISIMRVNNFDDYARVGGSSLGGGTFFGLCSLLTGCHPFSEALELASRGDDALQVELASSAFGGDDTSAASLDRRQHRVDLGRGDRTRADRLADRVERDRVSLRRAADEVLDERGELRTQPAHADAPVGDGQSLRKPTATTAPSSRRTSAPQRHFSTTLPFTRPPESSA